MPESKKAAKPGKGQSLTGVFAMKNAVKKLDLELASAKETVKRVRAERAEAHGDLVRILDDMESGQGRLDL